MSLQLCFSIDWIRSIPGHKQISMTSLNHGNRMYLHALTNKTVPDTNSLSINARVPGGGNLAEQYMLST